jgi:hypothetical protein
MEEKSKSEKQKGVPTAQGLLANEPLRDGDAFVRFGGRHPPLGVACLKTTRAYEFTLANCVPTTAPGPVLLKE